MQVAGDGMGWDGMDGGKGWGLFSALVVVTEIMQKRVGHESHKEIGRSHRFVCL